MIANTIIGRNTRLLLSLWVQPHQEQGQEIDSSSAKRCRHGDVSIFPHSWYEGWGPSALWHKSTGQGRLRFVWERSRNLRRGPRESHRNRFRRLEVSDLPRRVSHFRGVQTIQRRGWRSDQQIWARTLRFPDWKPKGQEVPVQHPRWDRWARVAATLRWRSMYLYALSQLRYISTNNQ